MAKKDNELTPMMKQFFSLKAKHPDALLLFRCGDFYETYCEDAIDASKILGITLTRRNNGGNTGTQEMAGFPYHALDTYLPKLIRAGRRVAICDQLEDPKLTKKLVKRGITELVTPGVAMSDNVLNHKENNFLAAIHFASSYTFSKRKMAQNTVCGVAFLDISTGEFMIGQGTTDYVDKLMGNFNPKEVLYQRECRQQYLANFPNYTTGTTTNATRTTTNGVSTYEMEDWAFNEQNARQKLLKHFNTKSLKGFGVDHLDSAITAAGAIMQYLELTQHPNLQHITRLARIEEDNYVRLDKFTIRSLELLSPMSEEGQSLIGVIDKTITPMGGRLLKRWVVFPLKDPQAINKRLDIVEYFFRNPQFRDVIAEQFQLIGDIERIISKAAVGRIGPREMVQLKNSLQALEPVKEACLNTDNDTLRQVGEKINTCSKLSQLIARQIVPEPPLLISKGGFIADGFNPQLDELRNISRGGKDYLMEILQREIQQTGISSLKIGYNNVFGYYLEVRNTYKDKVPEDWIRKQTLAQAERYITQELKAYEEKILGADERIQTLEEQLFAQLVEQTKPYIGNIQTDANIIAQIDCLLSFAVAAEEGRYIRPVITDENIIDIRQGRHPVIETEMPAGEKYVPNDIMLDDKQQQIIIITGPNMAGKSALLRQTALIVLMAQIGSFVPAEQAKIGWVDKIFTRVGASDNISLGESTFMVEMTEAANILNNATPRSLILFDELGRGTSTYDGISIAWAIVEHLHENPNARARTLFATHYHELNDMQQSFQRIKNYNVSVKEVDGKVIFVRKLERGGSDRSFGIHVAQMAGMPRSIVKRADQLLHELEGKADTHAAHALARPQAVNPDATTREGFQLSFFQLDDPLLCQLRDEIINTDINSLTPVEALNKLDRMKTLLKGKDD